MELLLLEIAVMAFAWWQRLRTQSRGVVPETDDDLSSRIFIDEVRELRSTAQKKWARHCRVLCRYKTDNNKKGSVSV